MSCLIDNGVARTCQFEAGGIQKLWMANFDEVTSITDGDADGVLDTITMDDVSDVFYEFKAARDSASFSSELQVNAGQKYYLQTLTFNIQSTSELSNDITGPPDATNDGDQTDEEAQLLQDLVDKLALGEFKAIIKTRTGRYFILGNDNPLEATVASQQTGAAAGDTAGYTLTFTSEGLSGAPLFDAGSNESNIPV